jgi:hypothetical protein
VSDGSWLSVGGLRPAPLPCKNGTEIVELCGFVFQKISLLLINLSQIGKDDFTDVSLAISDDIQVHRLGHGRRPPHTMQVRGLAAECEGRPIEP